MKSMTKIKGRVVFGYWLALVLVFVCIVEILLYAYGSRHFRPLLFWAPAAGISVALSSIWSYRYAERQFHGGNILFSELRSGKYHLEAGMKWEKSPVRLFFENNVEGRMVGGFPQNALKKLKPGEEFFIKTNKFGNNEVLLIIPDALEKEK